MGLGRLKPIVLFSLATCVALSCGAGSAAEPPVSLQFTEKDGSFSIRGSFLVRADRASAWDVLTDYDGIPEFIHNMKVSRVEIREGNDLLIWQEAEGGFLFFTQRVRVFLHIVEDPLKSIHFTDIASKDFHSYKGSWTIERAPGGEDLKVSYALDGERKFQAPAFLVNDAMSGSARDLLRAVRARILEYEASKRRLPAPPPNPARAPEEKGKVPGDDRLTLNASSEELPLKP